jgi:hypothetical protein
MEVLSCGISGEKILRQMKVTANFCENLPTLNFSILNDIITVTIKLST